MQKNVIGLRKLKVKIINKREKRKNRRKKNGGQGHRTAKAQCRGRGLQQQKV